MIWHWHDKRICVRQWIVRSQQENQKSPFACHGRQWVVTRLIGRRVRLRSRKCFLVCKFHCVGIRIVWCYHSLKNSLRTGKEIYTTTGGKKLSEQIDYVILIARRFAFNLSSLSLTKQVKQQKLLRIHCWYFRSRIR